MPCVSVQEGNLVRTAHCGIKPQCGPFIIRTGYGFRDDASDFCWFRFQFPPCSDFVCPRCRRGDLSAASDRGASCSSSLLALCFSFLFVVCLFVFQ
jgi:hypothetical protein